MSETRLVFFSVDKDYPSIVWKFYSDGLCSSNNEYDMNATWIWRWNPEPGCVEVRHRHDPEYEWATAHDKTTEDYKRQVSKVLMRVIDE